MTELNNEYPIMDKMDKMEAGKSAYPVINRCQNKF